jgi:hypothetical protein
MKRIFIACISIFWCTGCMPQQLSENSLREKESALNKLVASVESAVRFQDAPETLTEEQLKAFAVKDDPAQLEPFNGLLVRIRRQGVFSSVLVCTEDGAKALWEDAGCTPPLDLRLWNREPPQSCHFKLDLAQVCQPR